MMKNVARIASALILILLLCITDTYLKQVQEILPMNTDTALILDFKNSEVTKDQAIQDLSRIAQENDLTLFKIVADREDFLNGKDLYSFGVEAQEPVPIGWYDQKKHGNLYPAIQLDDASLNGIYMMAGSAGGKAEINSWIAEHGVQVSILESGKEKVLQQTIFGSGYGIALFCAFILLLITTMGWSANRTHSKSLRVLDGQKTSRIIAADILSLSKVVGISALFVALVGIIAIALIRGIEEIPKFGAAFLLALAFFFIILSLSMVCTVIIALPTASIIAQRKSGIAAYRLTSETVKALAIVLTALSLPGLTNATLISIGVATQASYWQMLADDVSLRILTASEKESQENEPKLGDLVQRAEQKDEVLLSYALLPEAMTYPDGQYDGIVLTNTKYLQRVATHQDITFTDVAPGSLATDFTQNFDPNLQLWCQEKCSLKEKQLKTIEGDQPFPAIKGSGLQEMVFYEHPLIINVDSVSEEYQNSFIGPLLTSSNIFFTSSDEVHSLVNELGLSPIVLSVDRIADVGLQQGQSAYERAVTEIIGLVLLLAALIISSAVAAYVYASGVRRRLFIQRAFGKSWLAILQLRFAYELGVAIGCSVVALIFCLSQGLQYSWTALIAPLIYLAISLLTHLAAAHKVFTDCIARKE